MFRPKRRLFSFRWHELIERTGIPASVQVFLLQAGALPATIVVGKRICWSPLYINRSCVWLEFRALFLFRFGSHIVRLIRWLTRSDCFHPDQPPPHSLGSRCFRWRFYCVASCLLPIPLDAFSSTFLFFSAMNGQGNDMIARSRCNGNSYSAFLSLFEVCMGIRVCIAFLPLFTCLDGWKAASAERTQAVLLSAALRLHSFAQNGDAGKAKRRIPEDWTCCVVDSLH